MASKNQRPIAVDLFAGAGGMTLGFEKAGFDVLAAVELDPIHASIHEYNFPFWTTICQSVTQTTAREIRELSAIGDRDIDVVFGGPPCQGFSLMGKRNLDDDRNSLVSHFLRLVLELKPKFFVMENVRGMTIGKHKKILHQVIEKFKQYDYQVRENYQVLNAANYGVPQNRRRLFLIGCRQEFTLPNYPKPLTQPPAQSHRTSALNSISTKEPNSLPITPNVQAAISDIPEAEQFPELKLRDWVIADHGIPSEYASKLRGLLTVANDYSYPRVYNADILTCSRRTKHTAKTIARFASTPPGRNDHISHFYRLNLKGLCTTLRAGTASNRGAFTSPRPIHPITPRCITVREAARLHSYPDWFRFHVTKWHGFRQIGNSVPPLLAQAVAREIIQVMGLNLTKPSQKYSLSQIELLHFKMSQAEQYHNLTEYAIARRLKVKQK